VGVTRRRIALALLAAALACAGAAAGAGARGASNSLLLSAPRTPVGVTAGPGGASGEASDSLLLAPTRSRSGGDVRAGPAAGAVAYLKSRQQQDGGFAEPGRAADPSLTAWVVLALAAAGERSEQAAAYLAGQPYPTATDLALRVLALDALGKDVTPLAKQLAALHRADGRIGPAVNSTVWAVIALRQAGRPVPPGAVAFLRREQARSGGWSWAVGGAPDSNDTAAAVEALRAAGVSRSAETIRRGLAYLAKLANPDGGFELSPGRGSDAQSTAWAIQAYLAAGRKPPRGALAYLARLRRPDGSYRYSARFVTTPVWVTSQVVPALLHRPLPLRAAGLRGHVRRIGE
jgi:hypothetical protein